MKQRCPFTVTCSASPPPPYSYCSFCSLFLTLMYKNPHLETTEPGNRNVQDVQIRIFSARLSE